MSGNDNDINQDQDDIDITDIKNTKNTDDDYSYNDNRNDADETNGINEDEEDNEIPEIELTQEMVDAGYFLPDEEKKRFSEELFEWIEIFSSALLTVILLFTFIFRLVTVQGPSMENTLHGGEKPYGSVQDNLIISNLFYSPKQGDIVVIQVPNPNFSTPIIKRVIAVEGQTVDFDFENWIVYVDERPIYEVDGKAAIEPYVNYEQDKFMNVNDISPDMLPIKVEPGKIFVMGDNRNHSSDSRSSSIGQIDVRNVVGRVLIRVFPFNKFGVVKPNAE
ncbi:MAG: signal peptidase I [Oscillospiraceae bacterium]|nr:signal peptidase I [Oscillospiraceae bacterium]